MDKPIIQQPASETAVADMVHELHTYLTTISALAYGANGRVNDFNAFDLYAIIEPAERKSKRILDILKRAK